MKYLIWKLLIVVLNLKLGVAIAALLHCIIPIWKVSISPHKQAKQRFHMNIAVHSFNSGYLQDFKCRFSSFKGTLFTLGLCYRGLYPFSHGCRFTCYTLRRLVSKAWMAAFWCLQCCHILTYSTSCWYHSIPEMEIWI